jgi:hypothetical protein
MKFSVERTSDMYGGGDTNNPPCQQAVRDGDQKDPKWIIELNTLEELMQFVKENGQCVLYCGSIEIYDFWRE